VKEAESHAQVEHHAVLQQWIGQVLAFEGQHFLELDLQVLPE
jgi:hypothetical protein